MMQGDTRANLDRTTMMAVEDDVINIRRLDAPLEIADAVIFQITSGTVNPIVSPMRLFCFTFSV